MTEEIIIPPPSSAVIKPGYKTTEFWMSIAAFVLTAVFASGAVTNETALSMLGIGGTVLTALGYKVSRTMVKSAGASLSLCFVFALGASQISCAEVKPRLANGASTFLDCETPDIQSLVGELIGIVKPAVLVAITGDGHVDTGKLEEAARAAKSNLARCALATAVAMVVTPDAKAGAPQSASLIVTPLELRSKFAAARASWGVAVVHTSAGDL
jgi:hypothetical protein